MRRIVCKNVKNLRDLGGFFTKENKVTKFNSIYRSDLPKDMSEEEIKYLVDNNLSTVIDLRKKEEVNRKGNCLNIPEFNYYNINLLGDKCPNEESDIPKGYMDILENIDTMYDVFNVIRKAKGSVLFNCSAGKDRTGVVSMLLLLLAQVYEDDIIADYQVSYTYIREDIRKMHKDNPDLPAFLGGSKLEYMEETLKLFFNKYKDINTYFKYLGFSDKEIKQIKSKLIK
ncbi:MAG: tyrosine-protein phosphatase [Firmicutes bacterium]|nr:tyrosine-protein phosphatase [Bacillota bacterium]